MAAVLIGENVEDIRRALSRLFTRAGHQVCTTFAGTETLLAALRAPPDLLIMNPGLPELEGLEVCRQLRADPGTAQVPIIMLSVRYQPDEVEAARAAGADDYIAKPFDNADLLARANQLLEHGRAAPMTLPDGG